VMVGSNISLSSSLSSSSSAAALLDWSTTSAGALVVSSFSTAAHQFIQPIIRYWIGLWLVQCFTSSPTQYTIRLYGRRFLQVKRPNQQYQSTEGESCKGKQHKEQRKYKLHICIDTQKSRQIQHTSITQQVP